MKYVKKPVVIEAFQFGVDDLPEWFTNYEGVQVYLAENTQYAQIPTLEGTMTANLGDFIIKGVKGEIYPCKEDIFKETYELVTE